MSLDNSTVRIRVTPENQTLAKGDTVFVCTETNPNGVPAEVTALKRSRRHGSYGNLELAYCHGEGFGYWISATLNVSPMWMEVEHSASPIYQVTWNCLSNQEARAVSGDYMSCCVAYAAIADTNDVTNVRMNGYTAKQFGTYCSVCNVHERWCAHIRPPKEKA